MKKILIIETEIEVINKVKWSLAQEGLELIEATNYEEALNKINEHDLDLIYLTADLPGADSLELYNSIISNPKTKNLSLIFLTNIDDISIEQSLSLINSCDYIVKPLDIRELVLRTRKYLGLAPTKILVIDQNQDIQDFIKKTLNAEGLAVKTAANSRAGHEIIKEFEPQLILIDAAIAHKEQPDFIDKTNKKYIPTTILSSFNDSADASLASFLDSYSFIIKPLRAMDLVLRIKKDIKNIATTTSSKKNSSTKKAAINDVEILQQEKKKLLDQISVTLNHEIRNPLTSIMIGSQALKNRFEDGSDEKQVIDGIEKCSKRIKDIMDSLGNMKNFVVDDYIEGIKMLKINSNQ
jgi:DNA-binding response OmpR family regulator